MCDAIQRLQGGPYRTELTSGDFFHLHPGTVHRDINPGEDEQVYILNFVGSGPLALSSMAKMMGDHGIAPTNPGFVR